MTEIEVAFAPTRVSARRRRLPPIAFGLAIVVLLGLAVVKPWGTDPGPSTSAPPSRATADGSDAAEATLEAGSPGADVATFAPVQGPDAETTAEIVHQLSARSGAWGLGVGGNGPRLVRDEPWTDWVAVEPGISWNGGSLMLWPDTGLCLGVDRLLSHPFLVAVTVPTALLPDWKVSAWLQDGSGGASLAGVVKQISPPGNRGISYLERVDQTPWPDGRYEFDVQAGDHQLSLSACIGAH